MRGGQREASIARWRPGCSVLPLEDGHEPWNILDLVQGDGAVGIRFGTPSGGGKVMNLKCKIRT